MRPPPGSHQQLLSPPLQAAAYTHCSERPRRLRLGRRLQELLRVGAAALEDLLIDRVAHKESVELPVPGLLYRAIYSYIYI